MALDPDLRNQLTEARKVIVEQLEEIETISARRGVKRGPPDFRDVYAQLQNELRDIDDLLGGTDGSEG